MVNKWKNGPSQDEPKRRYSHKVQSLGAQHGDVKVLRMTAEENKGGSTTRYNQISESAQNPDVNLEKRRVLAPLAENPNELDKRVEETDDEATTQERPLVSTAN